jgi:DNA polymerase-3 subunit beta
MKIKFRNNDLTKALNNIGKVISSKSVDPILENVLLKADSNITLIATNLEQGMQYFLKGEIIDVSDGINEIVLPFNLLRDVISKLIPDKDTEIEITTKKSLIRQESSTYNLTCYNPEAFALLPEVKEVVSFEINFKVLKNLIENTVFAASKKEEGRKEFKGIYFNSKENTLNFTATDSTALVINKEQIEGLPELNFIIPWKILDILSKIETESDHVKIVSDNNSIKFDLNELSLISLLINGKFPAYESVIPETTEYKIEVKKDELLTALRRVNVIASKGSERINLVFSDSFLEVSTPLTEIGEGKEKIDCVSPAEISLQFHADKLISGVEHNPSDTLEFGINGSLHPVVIKGKGTDSYTYIIMPQKPFE